MWGGMVTCAPVGNWRSRVVTMADPLVWPHSLMPQQRRLPTGAQDTILPHMGTSECSPVIALPDHGEAFEREVLVHRLQITRAADDQRSLPAGGHQLGIGTHLL